MKADQVERQAQREYHAPTWQINNLMGSFTGKQLLAAAAFISMILPMIVFFSMQSLFMPGLTAGAAKREILCWKKSNLKKRSSPPIARW